MGHIFHVCKKRKDFSPEMPGLISFSAVHMLKFKAEQLAKYNKIWASVLPFSPPRAARSRGKLMRGQGMGRERLRGVSQWSQPLDTGAGLCPRNTQWLSLGVSSVLWPRCFKCARERVCAPHPPRGMEREKSYIVTARWVKILRLKVFSILFFNKCIFEG